MFKELSDVDYFLSESCFWENYFITFKKFYPKKRKKTAVGGFG